jgi:hypothetical protein
MREISLAEYLQMSDDWLPLSLTEQSRFQTMLAACTERLIQILDEAEPEQLQRRIHRRAA